MTLDAQALHPLLQVTLANAPLRRGTVRVVVDQAGRTSHMDFPQVDQARAYAADVAWEGDAPAQTLVLLFHASAEGRIVAVDPAP